MLLLEQKEKAVFSLSSAPQLPVQRDIDGNDRIIDVIRPAVVVTLGRYAMTFILKKFDLPEKRGKISDLHGKLIKAQAPYGDIHIVPLYHPAVVLYSATQKDTLRKDFEKLKTFV